ncbi:MAG: hypothetical protein JXB49_21810 [Bacteroidales bacterium]|nr:hypothetical protein [Bacteroidales bacterium]
MARLLNSNDSASRCLNSVRRHQRLTRQVVNDDGLINQVQTEYNTLIEKVQLADEMEIVRENAYDDLLLSDRNLDDTLRTVFEKCKQYDRYHVSERVLISIFPEETFGDIIRLPYAKEVLEVEKTAVRIESLGANHALAGLAKEIRSKAKICKSAIMAVDNAIREKKMAEADVEIAKEALIRKYEGNYLDARKKYGRTTADKLFPRYYTNKSIQEIEENTVDAA